MFAKAKIVYYYYCICDDLANEATFTLNTARHSLVLTNADWVFQGHICLLDYASVVSF